MQKIKDWLKGKKSYLVAVGAILGVVVAWSAGEMGDLAAIQAVVAAVMAMTLRAGIAKVLN